MELKDFVGKPCKSRTACEFIPKKKIELNLSLTAQNLREKEVIVEMETPYLLLIKFKGKNISLFKSGKMIVKETQDESEARVIAEELINKIIQK
ncbi:MAG: hypothetical protein AB1467_06390 [Candidatus Diapherotrites archaeon]